MAATSTKDKISPDQDHSKSGAGSTTPQDHSAESLNAAYGSQFPAGFGTELAQNDRPTTESHNGTPAGTTHATAPHQQAPAPAPTTQPAGNTPNLTPVPAVYDDKPVAHVDPNHDDSIPDEPSDKKSKDKSGLNEKDLSDKESSPEDDNAGKAKDKAAKQERDSLFRDDPSGKQPRGKRAMVGNFLFGSKYKKFLFGAGVGGGGAILVLLALLMLSGSLLIPNFANSMMGYQFSRVTRVMADNAERVTAQKMAIESSDDGVRAQLKAKYDTVRGKTWGKLDKFRPKMVIKNLQTTDTLKFNYEPAVFGDGRLKSITIDGKEVAIEKTRFVDRFKPGVQFVRDVNFATEFAPKLQEALRTNGAGPLMRGRVAMQLRQKLGISLIAWEVGKLRGKAAAEADREILRAVTSSIDEKSAIPSKVDDLNNKAKDIQDALDECIGTDDCADKLAKTGELPEAATKIMKEVADPGRVKQALGTAVGVANPIYDIAVPLCMIYEGSIEGSGETIDAQSRQSERAGLYFMTAAHQQTDEAGASSEAIGALNRKLNPEGDYVNSNAYRRLSGNGDVNTKSITNPQSTSTGEFTLLNVLLGSNQLADTLNTGAGAICPQITSLWFGVLGGVVNGVLAFFSAGGTAAAGELVGQVGARAVARVAASAAKSFVKTAVTKKQMARLAIFVTTVEAATWLAQLVVAKHAPKLTGGIERGAALADSADAGANLHGSEMCRVEFKCRPVGSDEIVEDRKQNQVTRRLVLQNQSFHDRYLALTNGTSLAARIGTMAAVSSSSISFSEIGKKFMQFINPVQQLFSMSGNMLTGKAHAADAEIVNDYGNVQWDYTPDEVAILQNDESFQPLENEEILLGSGAFDDITDKYGPCFDQANSVGTMLANKWIERDELGNVIPDKGLCSPHNLGKDNAEFGPRMILRWRAAQGYDATLDNIDEVQSVGVSV